MFDIGFWEIIVISVIGLIVLGPERLPIAIRSVVGWINTLKEIAHAAKTEMSRELNLHELDEEITKAAKHEGADGVSELKKSIQELQQTARNLNVAEKKEREEDNKTVKPAKQKDTNKQDKTDEYK